MSSSIPEPIPGLPAARSRRSRRVALLAASIGFSGLAFAACTGQTPVTSPGTPTDATAASPTAALVTEAPSASESVASPVASSPEASAMASTSPSTPASPAVRTVQVYAIEGGFQNPPVAPTTGTVLTFRNVGREAHEMVVLRRNDDAAEGQNFLDLAKTDPAKLLEFVEIVGVLAADPGEEASGQVVLDKPGEYALVDLLPQGTMTAPASPDPMMIPSGVPNVASGSFAVFTVTEPEAE